MQWYVEENILSCCNTLIMRGTDVIDFRTFGYMDLTSRQPLVPDAIFRMYSNTKIVTSVAAMMLFDEGRFALDDPLATHLPEFADMQVLLPDAGTIEDVEAARSPMTMRQLLSHSAGLSYGFIDPESLIDRSYLAAKLGGAGHLGMSLEGLCKSLAAQPLAYQPGTRWRYSFATDVVARVVEVLSGQRFDEFLAKRIFTPLGMVDVGGNAQFVAVEIAMHAAAVDRWPRRIRLQAEPEGVETGFSLDLDHLRAEVGKDAGGLWSRDDPGEVADPNPLEWERSIVGHRVLSSLGWEFLDSSGPLPAPYLDRAGSLAR